MRGNLVQRLDKAIFNIEWRLQFPNALVLHLPYFKSDHIGALLIKLTKSYVPNKKRRSFKFMAEQDFSHFLQQLWKQNFGWNERIRESQGALYGQNENVFGDIFKYKKKLLRDLDAISHKITHQGMHYLEERQRSIWHDYQEVLRHEELLWFLRSRTKWLSFGVQNTHYFHGVTAIRRHKNIYEAIQDAKNNWVTNGADLERLVSRYFSIR